MSDIFHEVDEEVRREQLKQLWQRYNNLIIAVALLIIVGVGGWRAYEWWEGKKAAESGAAFDAAVLLAEQGKTSEAEAAFADLVRNGTPSYKILGKLREAAVVAKRDPKAAVQLYDEVAADGAADAVMRDLAALRAGYLLVDTGSYEDVRQRLEPLTAAGRPFRHSARGLLALSAWRAHDSAALKRWADLALADPETPPATRGQVEMLNVIAATESKG